MHFPFDAIPSQRRLLHYYTPVYETWIDGPGEDVTGRGKWLHARVEP